MKFTSTKLFKVILVVAVFGLLVFFNPYSLFNPIRSLFFGITYPFQQSLYLLAYKTNATKDFFSSIGEMKRENERLTSENRKLLADNAILRDVREENVVLREQLGLAPREKFNLEPALISSQDSHGLGNWITINKGKGDGIEKGMPVIVSNGILIGKVDEVYSGKAKVILITNPQSSINAVVSGTGAKGIARGEFGLGMVLDMVLQTDIIQEGNELITSGIGGDMPSGLLIGRVRDVHPSDDRLFQQATVTPLVKFSILKVVFVIKN